MLDIHSDTDTNVDDWKILLTEFENWVIANIPTINNRIENDNLSPAELVKAVTPWISRIRNILGANIHIQRMDARKLIQLLGFCASSIERHYQRHSPPGTGLGQISHLEDILICLGQAGDHPPRDTHDSYWIRNEEHRLSFTGSPEESIFNTVVTGTDKLQRASCDALRPICQGVSITSRQAVLALECVTRNTYAAHELYQSFMKMGADNHRGMSTEFFMKRMRTYLPSYPIKGSPWSSWGGVNAANLTSQMQVDYLTGLVNKEYADIVRSRYRYLTDEELESLTFDMTLPSISELLIWGLGFNTPNEVSKLSRTQLTHHIAKQPDEMKAVLWAYKRMFKAISQLTAYHWSLIVNYLQKPAAKLTPEELKTFAVPPTRGTGGKSHEETLKIMKMRRDHPIATKLTDCTNPK